MSNIEPALYSSKEAAMRLRVSVQTLRNRVREGVWPYTAITRSIQFTEDQIQQILKLSAVDTRPTRAPRNRKAS
jgi:predicted site-specific integrase-resolvase